MTPQERLTTHRLVGSAIQAIVPLQYATSSIDDLNDLSNTLICLGSVHIVFLVANLAINCGRWARLRRELGVSFVERVWGFTNFEGVNLLGFAE
jgi:hypothetical protein